MKIYLAAPWSRRYEAAQVAARLVSAGHTITRAWWEFEAGDEEHDKLRELAEDDLIAVQDAHELVVLNLETSEGKAVETGVALMAGIPVSVIGAPSNIFHHLDEVTCYESVDQWLATL